MPDYQQTAAGVRSLVQAIDQTNTPEGAVVAGAFAQVCREANERLRRCVDYLRRGHRSEAIHLADCQPKLLEMSAALDVPEIGAWENLCAGYGWMRAERILVDAAQELNEAYAVEQPLKELLARHRWLALARAPLDQRLLALRQLAKLDPNNPAWERDVTAFEQVRLREVKGEVNAALKRHDLPAIDRLLGEVSGQTWSQPVPEEIVTALSKTSQSYHTKQAVAELTALVPEVQAAVDAMSYADCKRVLARWSTIVQTHRALVPHALRDEIQQAARWVVEQDQLRERQVSHDALCAELRGALGAGMSLADMQVIYGELRASELEMPDDLRREYKSRADGEKNERRRESRNYLITAVCLSVALLAGIGLFILYMYLRARR